MFMRSVGVKTSHFFFTANELLERRSAIHGAIRGLREASEPHGRFALDHKTLHRTAARRRCLVADHELVGGQQVAESVSRHVVFGRGVHFLCCVAEWGVFCALAVMHSTRRESFGE